MKYQQYLDKLFTLFEMQSKLICTNFSQIINFVSILWIEIKKDDWTKINHEIDAYENMLELYYDVLKQELVYVNKNKLSIKKTLLATSKMVMIVYTAVYILQTLTQKISQTFKRRTFFKEFIQEINNFLQAYNQLQVFIKELNITYNEDISNIQFGAILIDDKDFPSIDLDKVLIPNKWKVILPSSNLNEQDEQLNFKKLKHFQ